MRHLLVMGAFALLTAIVFGVIQKDTHKDRIIYGLKVFAQFMVIGLALSWVLYFVPL